MSPRAKLSTLSAYSKCYKSSRGSWRRNGPIWSLRSVYCTGAMLQPTLPSWWRGTHWKEVSRWSPTYP
jgi:hypothetical protein